MGATTFIDKHTYAIAPSTIFKASIVDSHNLIPKLVPQAIKSIEIIQGNGGAGSIKQINFAEGGGFGLVKCHIDELNEETLTYKYSLVEGDALIGGLEKITYEVKFESLPYGGSISKVTSKYYTKYDFKLKEEDIKACKERVLGMYKVVEDYLLQNPHAYARFEACVQDLQKMKLSFPFACFLPSCLCFDNKPCPKAISSAAIIYFSGLKCTSLEYLLQTFEQSSSKSKPL